MKNQASCLCGSVSWEITAEPYNAFNCHCKMCRKAHGSAFATYWFVKQDQFNWLSGGDAIVRYRSSHLLTRSFCGNCGSVVPYASEQGEHFCVPGGCHDEGRHSDCEIFTAHSAPWYEITSNLPRHDDYPDETGMQAVADKPAQPAPQGIVRGSCLCGSVAFEIDPPFKMAMNCHCHRCRKARAAAHATNGFVAIDAIRFTRGEDNLASYKVPEAEYFTQVFCRNCGSKMPRLDSGRGIAVVPFGGLDDDPQIRPSAHIFVADKANWHEITDYLPRYDQEPVD